MMKILLYAIAPVLFVISVCFGLSQLVWANTDEIPVSLGEKFQLKINDTAYVKSESLGINLVNIQDSRCPSGVVCIWEGRANVWIDVKKGEEIKTFNMTTTSSINNPSTVQFKNYSITLLKVEPYPQKGVDITSSNYVVTMVVMQSDLLSPIQQVKSGIATKDVQCKQNFTLVIKASDGSPACVTPQTAQILVERGWAKVINS